MMRSLPFILLLLALPAVAAQEAVPTPPPSELLGDFRDDYGNSFRITESLFVQLPRLHYHVVEWNVAERYLVARNDSANPSDQGLWTRIDWMPFTGMAPYGWGFCLTAYRAPSEAAARATATPDRANPRTGCNGFPFSRMRRPEAQPAPVALFSEGGQFSLTLRRGADGRRLIASDMDNGDRPAGRP